MQSFLAWCCCVTVCLVGSASSSIAAAPLTPERPETIQGAIVSGVALTCEQAKKENEFWVYVHVWTVPLAKRGVARKSDWCSLACRSPLRWSLGHGGFWVSISADGFSVGLGRYDLGELLKGRIVRAPEEKEKCDPTIGFDAEGPATDLRALSQFTDFESELYSDNLAVGRYQIKQFVLTNVRGRRTPYAETDKLSASYIEMTPEEQTNPRWSLTVHGYGSSWDRKKLEWRHGKWVKEETIAVGFREPFRVLARGEDYYFLTASGRLFRAPKPDKGKHRKLETVWDEWRSPITALITDADWNRTFLFCDSGPKGKGGPCVFELASGVRPRFYEKEQFKPGDQGPDKLRRVLGYSRVLESLGYIKTTPPTVAPQKKK